MNNLEFGALVSTHGHDSTGVRPARRPPGDDLKKVAISIGRFFESLGKSQTNSSREVPPASESPQGSGEHFGFVLIEKALESDEMGFQDVDRDDLPSDDEVRKLGKAHIFNQLRKNELLSSETVATYVELVKGSFQFIPQLIRSDFLSSHEIPTQVTELIKQARDCPVFIPLILSGVVDHIVLITINPKAKCVEFFDSQGKKLESETREIKGLEMTPHALVKALNLEGYSSISNEKRYQGLFDHVNCGVYVSQFIKARVNHDFKDACAQMKFEPKEKREQMAKEIEMMP